MEFIDIFLACLVGLAPFASDTRLSLFPGELGNVVFVL